MRIEPSSEWFDSAKNATATAIAEGVDHKPERSIYAHLEVRKALEKLFSDKCAYCESKIANTSWDVEHYRPKGRVSERPEHPGYYWLTYEWTNLFPSCEMCNQSRRDRPTWDDPTSGPAAGKLDQFPLLNESNRAMDHNAEVDQEDPSLINPCVDRPARYLSYDPTGTMLPKRNTRRGDATIRVLNLNRKRLRKLRLSVLSKALDFLETIRALIVSGNTAAADDLEDLFNSLFLSKGSEYSGMVKEVLRDPVKYGI